MCAEEFKASSAGPESWVWKEDRLEVQAERGWSLTQGAREQCLRPEGGGQDSSESSGRGVMRAREVEDVTWVSPEGMVPSSRGDKKSSL